MKVSFFFLFKDISCFMYFTIMLHLAVPEYHNFFGGGGGGEGGFNPLTSEIMISKSNLFSQPM